MLRRVTLAESWLLSNIEAKNFAIDGETLAIAWGLEQTRYFTQGCSDLTVIIDHKPLLKICLYWTLDKIGFR